MNDLVNGGVSVAIAIVGVALLAVLVSRQANTAGIITAGGNSLARALGAATAPLNGGGFSSLGNSDYGPGYFGG